MAARTDNHPDTVKRCVPRQDGGFLIVTRKGASGACTEELSEGAHVVVANGIARRPGQ